MPGILSVCPKTLDAVCGDDWWMSFTLYEDGLAVNLTSATIVASVRSLTDMAVIIAQSQSPGSTGANWAAGLIIVSIPSALTDGLTKMEYFLEIETFLNGRFKTWPLVEVEVIRTTIPR